MKNETVRIGSLICTREEAEQAGLLPAQQAARFERHAAFLSGRKGHAQFIAALKAGAKRVKP